MDVSRYTIVAGMLCCALPVEAEVIEVPGDHATIQAAIVASDDGDEIVVSPGVYNEVIDFLGKAVYLSSTGGAMDTFIDGTGGDASVVTCIGGEGAETVLEGFTVQNGVGTFIDPSGRAGGGMRIEASSPTVRDCVFRFNSARWGGGVSAFYGSSPLITDCEFADNEATAPSPGADVGEGGGMFAYESSPTVTSCSFHENVAAYGGGLLLTFSSGLVADCDFSFNHSDPDDGGGLVTNHSAAEIRDCVFVGNSTTAFGGGLTIDHGEAGEVTVEGCVFDANTADLGGGAMAVWYAGAGTGVTRCRFESNETAGSGGGLRIDDESTIAVQRSRFIANEAGDGGGIAVHGGTVLSLADTELRANVADLGGAIMNGAESQTNAANCTIMDNVAHTSGGAFFADGVVTVANSILWGDAGGEITVFDTVNARYSDIEGGFPGAGNIDMDPLCRDRAGGDLQLDAGSPCIDAGDNLAVPADVLDLDGDGDVMEPIPFDRRGRPRFIDDPDTPDTGNPDGLNAIVDIGAHEFRLCPMDVDGSGAVGFDDLVSVLASWGPCEACATDFDDNGEVDFNDLVGLLANWGPC